ncbi:hypothetical protein ACFCYH_26580 [Streptomyces sp. NPDC056400]|uniref:hypothetical protein n=1 Tax=Streptomyces sp. NPDC056400 TaxID=3345808 RepID=UPI0035D9837A
MVALQSRTPRGARPTTVTGLRSWGVPPSVTERAEHVVAELTANAVLHGQVQGRDFRPPSGKTVWAEAEIPAAHAAPSGQSAEERL